MKKTLDKTDNELLLLKDKFVMPITIFSDYCKNCSFEEIGKLFYSVFYYQENRTMPIFPDRATERLFYRIKNIFDKEDEYWLQTKKRAALSGSKHKGNQYTNRNK